MGNATNTESFSNLQIAAHMRAESITPSLFQLIGNRQVVAQQLLAATETNERHQTLVETYNHLNNQIKMLLGI